MGKPGHDYTVKLFLTAEQFVALQHMAEDEDVSQSSFLRRLLIDRINSQAKDYVRREQIDMTTQDKE